MRKNISHTLSEFFSSKTLLVGVLIFAVLFLPLHVVQAGGLADAIAGAIMNYLALGLSVVFGALAAIVKLMAELISSGMEAAIRAFINIPVSPSNLGTPLAIREAWATVRNLVNIVFILILTFIGLATILRLQTYQMQKTLPSLIIVAILINFSGVLVGFVADIGSVITKALLNLDCPTGESCPVGKWSIGGDLSKLVGLAGLGTSIISIIYYTISLLIYFIVVLLFGIRTLVLWTLAILAPIAFAAYILPGTKKYWTQWLGQLIQWSIIGIPISLTLYLAKLVITPDKFDPNTLGFSGAITGFFAPLTALFLLFTGVTLSMQLAPAGAQGVINMGKKAGLGAYKKAWKVTRDRIPEGARRTMERMATGENPAWGQGHAGLGGFLLRRAAGATGYTRRATGGLAKSAVIGGEQADAEKAKAKASKQDVVSNMKDLRQTGSVAERTAIMDAMRQKNQIKDALNPDIVGANNVLRQNEATSVYQKAHRMRNSDLTEGLERSFVNQDWRDANGNTVNLVDANGNPVAARDAQGNVRQDAQGNTIYRRRKVADEFADITDRITANSIDPNDRTQGGLDRRDREERRYESFADKVIGEAKTADEIKALQKNWWNNDDLMNAAHRFWGGSQTSQAATNFGRDFVNRLEATKKDASWYFELEEIRDSGGNLSYTPRNLAMPRYLASSTAQGLGIAPLEGAATPPQANAMTQLANAWAPHIANAGIQNEYTELQAILRDRNELQIMRRVPNTGPAQAVLLQQIQNRRTALQNDLTALLGQYPELRTVIARTEEFLDRGAGGQRRGGGAPGVQQPPPGGGPGGPGGAPQQPPSPAGPSTTGPTPTGPRGQQTRRRRRRGGRRQTP
jgi:hypothetical protein